MPIPDKIIFGKHLNNDSGITFGEVRKIAAPSIQLQYLKRRIETYLIKQIDPIGDHLIYAPFPLAVMTCLACETLGRIIEPIAAYEQDPRKKSEIPKIASIKIYGMLDPKLTRPLSQEYKNLMQEIWPADNVKGIVSYAELFHSYLRTSFIHGYRGKNVFLTECISSWSFEEGSLFINPYWFWKAYKDTLEAAFKRIFDEKEKNNPIRNNALDFFNRLIYQ